MMRSHSIPAPRRVRHLRSLMWWLMLVGAVALVQYVQGSYMRVAPFEPPAAPAQEREAFVAFVFGKVSRDEPQAIQPEVLRAQLEQLKASGAHAVRLADVQAFLHGHKPLPEKPVLIVFDEARRTTVEAVDPILKELELPAVAFVTTEAIDDGNLELVSRRQLGQMVQSGRWELGVSACQSRRGDENPPPISAKTYTRERTSLTAHSGRPPLAIGCLRPWRDDADDPRTRWTEVVQALGFPLGFVTEAPGANYRDDSPLTLRMVRIPGDSQDPQALLQRLAAYGPRRSRYVDDFKGQALAPDWIANPDHAEIARGELRLTAGKADPGGYAVLGGTQHWQDSRVEVELAAPPSGQFWIYVRRSGDDAFLRLGLVGRRAVLQKSDADGQTHQLVAQEVGPGALRLTLRVSGNRALAYVDGRALLDRPAELPGKLDEGPVMLATWNASGDAGVRIRRVEAEPLQRRLALISAEPSVEVFNRLREGADKLWAVSPQLYRWRGATGARTGELDRALAIFIGHEHLSLLPAVTAEALPRVADKNWQHFVAQLRRWVDDGDTIGLNLLVDKLDADQAAQLDLLRKQFSERGKQLLVSVRRPAPDVEAADYPWLVRGGGRSGGLLIADLPLRLVSG